MLEKCSSKEDRMKAIPITKIVFTEYIALGSKNIILYSAHVNMYFLNPNLYFSSFSYTELIFGAGWVGYKLSVCFYTPK
jgi:hypothetical protein